MDPATQHPEENCAPPECGGTAWPEGHAAFQAYTGGATARADQARYSGERSVYRWRPGRDCHRNRRSGRFPTTPHLDSRDRSVPQYDHGSRPDPHGVHHTQHHDGTTHPHLVHHDLSAEMDMDAESHSDVVAIPHFDVYLAAVPDSEPSHVLGPPSFPLRTFDVQSIA